MFSTCAPSKQLLQCKNRVFVEQLCARQNLKSNLEYVNILSYINLKKNKTPSFVNNYTRHSWQSLKPGAPLN